MKNICERLLLGGRHWYSTNEILKFYYLDKWKFLHFASADILLGFFFILYYFWVLGKLPRGKLPPTAKLTLSQTLTLTGGWFLSGAIVWLSSNPKSNPDLDPNLNANGGAIFLGGQLSGNNFLLRNLYICTRNTTNIVAVWSSFICPNYSSCFPPWLVLKKCGVWFDV